MELVSRVKCACFDQYDNVLQVVRFSFKIDSFTDYLVINQWMSFSEMHEYLYCFFIIIILI